jgi:hypothetical protein
MHVLRAIILVGTTLLLLGGIVASGQEQRADDISCAFWLQQAGEAKRARPGAVSTLQCTPEVLQQHSDRLAEAYNARGFQEGYATGVFATTPRGPRSHIRNVGEFVTALDALCAGAPHKRVIDVALHVLGRR